MNAPPDHANTNHHVALGSLQHMIDIPSVASRKDHVTPQIEAGEMHAAQPAPVVRDGCLS